MNNENNKMQVDIENLFKQNVNDLSAIKELYRKLKEVEEKITQNKYIDSTLANKLKKEYEKLKRIILDENASATLSNEIETVKTKLTNDIKTIELQLTNDIETIELQLTDDIETINSQMNNIVKVNDNNELNDFFNKIENNTKVKLKKSTYVVDDVLILDNKHNVEIDLNDATLKQNKHGYGVLELKYCTNLTIKGGKIIGAGDFPAQTINNSAKTLHNEKTDCPNDWGTHKNGSYVSTAYNGGYLYNVSFGILILENCKNIIIDNVETSGFNYVGIGVGFRGKIDSHINENITIKNCYCHDNFCAGIHLMHIDGGEVFNNKCKNNGHPSALQNDFDCNPGYGISCRNSDSFATNVNIYNNDCSNNKRKGIDVHGGADIDIYNNTIKNCNYWGIASTRFNGKVKNINIKDNTIKNCATVTNGYGILCDSDGINIIENNKILDSGLNGGAINIINSTATVKGNVISKCATGDNRNAVDITGNVTFTNNTIEDSGKKRAVSVYPTDYIMFNNNVIKSKISNIKTFISKGENSSDELVANIKDNIYKSFVNDGIDLQCINIGDGIIDGNSFTPNSVNTNGCGFYIGTNNKYYSDNKTSRKPITNDFTTVDVKIVDGNITFTDTNNIISEVIDSEKGVTIKTGNYIVKGISYLKKSTETTDVTDVVVRNIYDNIIDIGLITVENPQYGQAGSTINYFNGLFTINVI